MPIPLDALRSVRSIIVHQKNATTACPDGRASALILHAALPSAHITEMAYGSPEHKRLLAEPGMLFCDFTPPADRLQEFVEAGALVLDHHHRDLVEPFGERGVFGENAKLESGAVLALREALDQVSHEERVNDAAADIARLAAIRDTWQPAHRDWYDACELSAALTFPPLEDLLDMGPAEFLSFAAQVGPMLLKKARLAATVAAETAVWFRTYGWRVAVVSDHQAISDAAELLGDKADIVAAFEYVHDDSEHVRLVVHLRSRGTVDVQAIARHFPSGGGHKNASGFSREVDLAAEVSPYERVQWLLDQAIAALPDPRIRY